MKALLVALVVVSVTAPLAAQSRVPDIYGAMAESAARRAQIQADLWSRTIADLTRLLAPPLLPPPVVLVPVAPAPVWTATHQRYYEAALAYEAERAVALRAVTAAFGGANCGVRPVKPVRPVGCRDLVAQCVLDANGRPYWQWVCVK